MSWIQVHITTNKEEAPFIELLLENLGALSVTLEDAGEEPLLEPGPGESPLWQQTKVTALFPGDRDAQQLCHTIRNTLRQDLAYDLMLERFADQAWERAWMDSFRPMQFGRRLWICPDGMPPDDPNGVVVEMDPGLAFGTGTHATTALCLQWLDGVDLDGRQVMDFGCGSGILAIAALRLGAKRAIAVDHDPQALQATRDNGAKNSVLPRLSIYGTEEIPDVQNDILLANILAGTLIELEPVLSTKVRSGGKIVLSGILREQAEEVIRNYQNRFLMAPPKELEGWLLLHGTRR
jgi:ribosomal protein L11 methyltransferase